MLTSEYIITIYIYYIISRCVISDRVSQHASVSFVHYWEYAYNTGQFWFVVYPVFSHFLFVTVSYQEHLKDASYITVSSRPTPDSEPGARIVKSMSLKAAITKGQIVRLGQSNKAGGSVKPSVFEVNKFFRRLSFIHQVREDASRVSN